MKGKIFVVGDSLETKLLKESLLERGLEVKYFKKKEFEINAISPLIDVLVYELSYEETKNPSLVTNFLRAGLKCIIFLAEEADLENAIEFIKKGAYDFKLLSTPLEILEKVILYALEEKEFCGKMRLFLLKILIC